MLENLIFRGVTAGLLVLIVDIYRYYSFIGDQYKSEFNSNRNKIFIIYAVKIFTYPFIGIALFRHIYSNAAISAILIAVWAILFFYSYFIIIRDSTRNLKK